MVVIKPENYFWLHNGEVISDLYGLSHAMKIMDDSVFNYHANSEKNDFYNWVRDILKDSALAKKLLDCKTREQMSSVIEKRMSQIMKIRNKKESKRQIISKLMEVHNA